MYTTEGTFVAASFSGTCSNCGAVIHHSHYEPKSDEKVENFFDPGHSPYIQVSSQTVFSTALLQQVTQQVVHAAATFESQADVYNATFMLRDQQRLSAYAGEFSRVRNPSTDNTWKLNDKRLEDGWFIYHLAEFHCHNGTLNHANFHTVRDCSNRRNIECLCEEATHILSTKSPKWVKHICDTKGCSEGFAVVDGNEKVNRSMCAAPKSKVYLDQQKINMMQCCPRSPASGGKSKKPSKFCHLHSFLDDESSSTATHDTNLPVPQPSHPMLDVSNVGTLPDNECTDVLVGCKKARAVNKFYDRTAGILAMVRPCGVIVNACEMYTCESPTQVYIFLITTFARGRDIERLRYIGYDRACDLHPFMRNLSEKGAYFATWLLRHVSFLVDSFHVRNHTEACCMPPENDRCEYHPSLPKFAEIHGTNTECAEQAFRWLNKLRYSMKSMHQHRFNFFLYVVTDVKNSYREMQLKEKNKM